jgi:segregation and condensation protein A
MSETPENQGHEAATDDEGAAGETSYRIQVGEFQGPLDLLLHLVRVNEVDITDIPIVTITEQYSEYLEMMRELNLEIAGEYLVMAATLMYIKSRMLLPPDPVDETEEAEDPRADLAQQLLEYQRFKQAAENLHALDSRRDLIWTRDEAIEEFEREELLTVELFDLIRAFSNLLGRLDEEEQLRLRRDNVSVAEKISWLSDLLDRRKSLDLIELARDLPTRLDRIATFLALLEMIRLRLVVAYQRKPLGEIRITKPAEVPTDTPAVMPATTGTGPTGPAPLKGTDGA